MKRVLKGLGTVGAFVLLTLVGAFFMAQSKAMGRLDKQWDTHTVDIPVPFPLSEAEVAALRAERSAGLDADAGTVATQRALERGKHLLESRYSCFECHGRDLGGGTMMDAPPVGRFFGVNLTTGKGSAVAKYTVSDWDRIVRHGVKPDRHGTVMPSIDFMSMSDQELSDLITYIRAQPPVDREQPRPEFGPVGLVLMAKGDINLSAELVDHQKAHERVAPGGATKAFGEHLAQVCTGCHGPALWGYLQGVSG